MKYEHPTIRIDEPLPGHYLISGYHPAAVFVPDVGHIVPLRECYIAPELPTETLRAIIADREGGNDKPPKARRRQKAGLGGATLRSP